MELIANPSSLSFNKSHFPFISPFFRSCSRRRLNFPARVPHKVLYQSCEPFWCRPIWGNVRGGVVCSSGIREKSPESRKDGNLGNFGGLGKWGVLIAVLGYSVIRCQRVLAAEGFVAASRVYLNDNWPKILQVLGVFKEQGLILSVLLGLSAFFSMAETSITTLWPWKVRELAEKEPEDGVFRMLRSDVTRFLTTILIGTTVVNIGATALVTEAATTLFGEAGITAATGVMTVAILLLTEITPKSIAVHHATEVARFVVRPVAWLSLILYPVGRIVTFLSMGMLKLLGLKARR